MAGLLGFSLGASEITVLPQERKQIAVPGVEPGHKLKLRIEARLDSPKMGGMLDAMILMIGGSRITDKELINRPDKVEYRGRELPLFRNSRWMVPYAPDFEVDVTQGGFKDKNLFVYEFDLGGLVRPGQGADLTIVNPWTAEAAKRWNSELKLVARIQFSKEKADEKTAAATEPAENEVFIAPEKEHEWEILHNPGEKTLLKIKLHQVSPQNFGGWNYSVKFTLNGQPLRSRLDRETLLLKNRPESFVFKDGRTMYYDQGDGAWLAIYSSGYTASPAHYGMTDPDPYVYVLDVTPLLKPGKNILNARNLWTQGATATYKREMLIAVILDILNEKADIKQAENIAAAPEFDAPQRIAFDKEGALEIHSKSGKLRFVSQFSRPGGGWNYLGAKGSADAEWHFKTGESSAKQAVLEAAGGNYRLSRRLTLDGNRLKVADTFENPGNAEVAVRFANELDFSGMRLPVCRMGGMESHSLNNYGSPENSTMFFPGKGSGLGIVLEDDIVRNHAEFYYELSLRRSGFRDDFFYLEPGAKYTVEWSVYVMPQSDDYYDFINRVRRDWRVNYTIDGPYHFVGLNDVYQPEAGLRKIIERKNIRYVCFWEIGTPEPVAEADNKRIRAYGTALFNPHVIPAREKHVQAAARWHELFPGIKVSQYYHCFFQGFEKEDDMTYRDSFITAADGSRVASTYSSKTDYVYRTVYPVPGNSFWKVHIDSLDYLFDTMKIDWLYWDESNGPGTTAKDRTGSASVTFNTTDGNSALIDKTTNAIIKKCAILAVISAPALQEGIDRARKAGGITLFNGAPTMRYRNQPGVYSMTETQDVISRANKLHLTTPLAYGVGSPPFSAIVERLNYGTVYLREHLAYDSLALSKFFPLTVEELHRGWIKAEERIITNRSGDFGWDGGYSARVWSFDKDGKLADENPAVKNYEGKTSIEVLPGGLTVLERSR